MKFREIHEELIKADTVLCEAWKTRCESALKGPPGLVEVLQHMDSQRKLMARAFNQVLLELEKAEAENNAKIVI